LSQYALAKKSGVTKQVLSRLELGTNGPSWETVQLLALALGVSCQTFVNDTLALPESSPRGKPGRPHKAEQAEPPAAKSASKKTTRKRKGKL